MHSIHSILISCIDLIFPTQEEALCVRDMTEEDALSLYAPSYANGIYTLTHYQNIKIKSLIHEAKFHGNKKAWRLLNTLFRKYLEMHAVDVIIPIPLSRKRMRARGYNQVLQILRGGKVPLPVSIEVSCLERVRHTRPQTELARAERLTNMHDAFGVVHGERLNGKHILLIDDVATTGTTLRTAKATLLPFSPASVTCLALAH